MNLTLFFRLITMSIFQDMTGNKFGATLFYCPRVYAMDGFNISLQIHRGNYASSENGYRRLGHTWDEVEYGYPSENEEMMFQYDEMYYGEPSESFNITESVGRIPVSVMEKVFEKHGGVDWEKTISVTHFTQMVV